MWLRRTLSVIVVLVALLLEWGQAASAPANSVPAKFAGLQAVVDQVVSSPGIVPWGTIVVWVIVFGVWSVMFASGRTYKKPGWDLGLWGLWGLCAAVWTQVLLISNGSLQGGAIYYFDLGLGFWLFLLGLFVSIAIRFTGVVFEMILELLSSP